MALAGFYLTFVLLEMPKVEFLFIRVDSAAFKGDLPVCIAQGSLNSAQ